MKNNILLLDTTYIFFFFKKTFIDELNQWLVIVTFVQNKYCTEKDDNV